MGVSTIVSVTTLEDMASPNVAEAELMPVPFPNSLVLFIVSLPIFIQSQSQAPTEASTLSISSIPIEAPFVPFI